MEDYIYILIGIGWIVYSIYKRNQKQIAKNNNQSPSTNKTSAKSLLQELLTGEKFEDLVVQPSTSGHPYNEIIENDEEINFEEDIEEVAASSNKTFVMKPESYITRKIQNTDKAETDIEINLAEFKDFDLRKAVLYSEILKRPYC